MLLRALDVSKHFTGVTALSRVSLGIERGEIVGVIGPNGSGKSTFLNIISGLVRADSGTVQFEGTDLLPLPAYKIAIAGIRRTFQIPQFCSDLTVFENIAMGAYRDAKENHNAITSPFRNWRKAIDMEAVMNTIKLMDLENRASDLPRSLTTFERCKTEIARALVSQPKLLLLDEPTSGFTHSERNSLVSVLRKIRTEGTTIAIIEHDLALVNRLCDKVLVLDAGRKVAEAAPQALFQNPKVSEIYLGTIHAAS